MRRRDFIKGIVGSAVAWPLVSRAQSAMPLIGFLNGGSSKGYQSLVAAFHQGLSESGYVEGQNLAIEYRWADGDYEKLPRLATDLVDRHVSPIFANAQRYQPPRLQQPRYLSYSRVAAMRLELLRELVPAATSVGFLANPARPAFQSEVKDAQQAAQALGVKLIVLNASTEAEIDTAFAEFSPQGIAALPVGTDVLFLTRRDQIVALANGLRVATMYNAREYVVAGGLISYPI